MKRWGWALAALMLAGCSDEIPEAPEAPAKFASNPYRYCMDRDPGWMRGLLDRIEAAAPAGSTATYDRLNVQTAMVDGVLQPNAKEIQLRLTLAGAAGRISELVAYGVIDPVTCTTGVMHVFEEVRLPDESNEAFATA